jgi:outer membrane protein assembly factor BamB
MRLAATLALLTLVSPARADDWPQWMGPNRDGVWREDGILANFPAGGPKKLWEARVGQGYAGPAVAGGKVYLMDRRVDDGQPEAKSPFDRSEQRGGERVLCLDAATGKLVWEHSYPSTYRISYAAGPRCTPTVDGDRVYTLGAMGDLFCLEANTGKAVWSKNFISDFGATVPVWGFSAHPLVDGDKLICLVGGSDGRLVMAFDKATGAEKWRALSFERGDFGYSPPVIYDIGGKRQLIIWHPRALVGLDPETGKRLWEVPFEARNALTAPMPRKEGDKLFVTSFYNGSMLVRVTDAGAEAVWRSKSRGEAPNQTTDLNSIIPTPVVKDGYVYGVCSYGQLRCIELDTGRRVWETMQATRGPLTPERVRDRPEPNVTQPWSERWANAFLVEHRDRYLLFNEQGELIIAKLSPEGYEEVARAQLLTPTNRLAGRPVVWSHPAFAEKCIFARNDEMLVCYSLAE